MDENWRAKVTDFGATPKKRLGASGTPYFMAPELLRGESQSSCQADVYAFGIVLFEIYSRCDPYEGEDFQETIEYVADPNLYHRPGIPPSCPQAIQVIMLDCLAGNRDVRPSFDELDAQFKALDAARVAPVVVVESSSLGHDDQVPPPPPPLSHSTVSFDSEQPPHPPPPSSLSSGRRGGGGGAERRNAVGMEDASTSCSSRASVASAGEMQQHGTETNRVVSAPTPSTEHQC